MNKKYVENKELFKTCVGSHAWKMNNEQSDKDVFKCYIAPSSDFLIGKTRKNSHFSQVNGVDTTSTEIGVVVTQLLKNNVNYLVNVMSPIIIQDSKELQELRILTQKNLSKQCFNSIYGLAYGNYKKYIITDKQNTEKKRKVIARTLLFGYNLLVNHEFIFRPVITDVSVSELEAIIRDLSYAYNESTLPETSQHKEEMYEWLLKLRINKLKEEGDYNIWN